MTKEQCKNAVANLQAAATKSGSALFRVEKERAAQAATEIGRQIVAAFSYRPTSVAAIIVFDSPPNSVPHVLLQQRHKTGRWHDGMWMFPGGKPEAGETLEQAAARELMEETTLGVSPDDVRFLTTIDHQVEGQNYLISILVAKDWFFWGEDKLRNLVPESAADLRFFPINQLPANMAEPEKQLLSGGEYPGRPGLNFQIKELMGRKGK